MITGLSSEISGGVPEVVLRFDEGGFYLAYLCLGAEDDLFGSHVVLYEFSADPPVLFYREERGAIDLYGFAGLQVLVIGLADMQDKVSPIDLYVCAAGVNHFSVHFLVMLQVRIEQGHGDLHFCIMVIIRKELDRLVGDLGEFIGAGQLVER